MSNDAAKAQADSHRVNARLALVARLLEPLGVFIRWSIVVAPLPDVSGVVAARCAGPERSTREA